MFLHLSAFKCRQGTKASKNVANHKQFTPLKRSAQNITTTSANGKSNKKQIP
jgi:hypothetical protein